MLPKPVITRDLALRVGRSETAHMVSWLGAIARFGDNPFDAEVHQLGGATALLAKRPGKPGLGPLFNRVLDFGDDDVPVLDEAIHLYAERNLPCRIDLNPHAFGSSTMGHLVAAGFRPFRHHDHLVGFPQALELSNPAVEIQEVDESNRAVWADVWRQGFLEVTGIAEADGELFAEATSHLAADPAWTLFLAYIDGKPAAAAGLHVQNGIGSLSMAATTPDFRGRGCQTALLQSRMTKAAELGCELVAAQAALDAQSHRNMQRAGLSIAYTRAFWLRRTP